MNESNSVIAVYNSHTEAEQAVAKLGAASFDIRKFPLLERTTIRKKTSWATTPRVIA